MIFISEQTAHRWVLLSNTRVHSNKEWSHAGGRLEPWAGADFDLMIRRQNPKFFERFPAWSFHSSVRYERFP